MNIHVSKTTFDELMKATIVSVEMGSKMYSLNNEKSDTDILHIIATPKGWNDSLVWTHHNVQFKEEGVDHVFTTLQNFIRNILKGDSTINYECLYSKELENSELSFVCDMRKDFANFSLVRSYLGLAKRDLKLFSQNYDNKKLFHGLRGLWTAKRILDGSYSNDIKSIDPQFYDYLRDLKNNNLTDRMELIKKMKETKVEIDQLRLSITDNLQTNILNRIMEESKLEKLDSGLKKFCNTQEYLSKVLPDIEIKDIYKVLNTEVTYT